MALLFVKIREPVLLYAFGPSAQSEEDELVAAMAQPCPLAITAFVCDVTNSQYLREAVCGQAMGHSYL